MSVSQLRRSAVITFLCCLLALLPGPSAAETDNTLMQRGNEAYSRGDYDGAIASYSRLIDEAGLSAPVLYNLANSYALAGKTGLAVLNYERALRLASGDSDISGNLELLKKERGLFAGESSLEERLFRLLQPDRWAWLILLALVIFTLFRLTALRFRFSGATKAAVAIFCLLVLALGASGTLFGHRHFNPAVVVVPDGRLLVSPFASATSVGAIQEGRLVYPDKHYGDFLHVTDETNRQGWLPRQSIIQVVPEGNSPKPETTR